MNLVDKTYNAVSASKHFTLSVISQKIRKQEHNRLVSQACINDLTDVDGQCGPEDLHGFHRR